MGERLRLSNNKANLAKEITDAEAQRLLQAIAHYRQSAPDPDQELPAIKPAPYFASPFAKPKPVYPAPYLTGNPDNVLVIADTHEPYAAEGYIEWCREQQEIWDCGVVVHAGDACDFAAISQWESDPDLPSAGDELNQMKEALQKTYAIFPQVKYLAGNHDLRIARKAKAVGLSKYMVRSLKDVMGAPQGWDFSMEHIIHGVCYQHGGAGGDAFRYAKDSRRSTVQGHLHSQSFVQWSAADTGMVFGLQVGSGVDIKAEAFAYGKPYPKKPVLSCGIVLNKGKIPFPVTMS